MTPIYTGNSDYIALVVSNYPEAVVGQRMHLWIGKKTGSDFLSRNGALTPKPLDSQLSLHTCTSRFTILPTHLHRSIRTVVSLHT